MAHISGRSVRGRWHLAAIAGLLALVASATLFSGAQTAFAAAPAVTDVSPDVGPTGGGTVVTVTGTNLGGVTAVKFGSTSGTSVSVNGAGTIITVTSPAHSSGTVDVKVTTPGGTSAATSADRFTYVSQPTVTDVVPGGGPTAGGTLVTVYGTSLATATSVNFGGTILSPSNVTSSSLQVISPPHVAGTVSIRVTTAGGTSPNTVADDFVYGLLPVVTGIFPLYGPTSGGTTVTVTGSGFLGAMWVDFGGVIVSVSVVDDNHVLVVSPPGLPGQAHVRVVTPAGTSALTSFDIFTYISVPVVTQVSPSSGPTAGGTTVIISGYGFTGTTSVAFGATNAVVIGTITDTQITVSSPAHSAGMVDVRVTNSHGTSAITAADHFTYIGSPTVTYSLYFRWTIVIWAGADNASVKAAIRGQESPDDPATNDVSSQITAIFYWNSLGQAWLGYFPSGENIPGANDFTTFRSGQPYWVAIMGPGTRAWTVRAP